MKSSETAKSLKGYFLFVGVGGLLLGIKNFMGNFKLNYLSLTSLVLTIVFTCLYLYIGFRFHTLIKNSVGFIKKSIILCLTAGILSNTMLVLAHPRLVKVIVPSVIIVLLINVYLYKSVEKVALQV